MKVDQMFSLFLTLTFDQLKFQKTISMIHHDAINDFSKIHHSIVLHLILIGKNVL